MDATTFCRANLSASPTRLSQTCKTRSDPEALVSPNLRTERTTRPNDVGSTPWRFPSGLEGSLHCSEGVRERHRTGCWPGAHSETAKMGTSPTPDASGSKTTPIVIVVDNDASVRKRLELLIRTRGWRALTFASAGQFLAIRQVASPCCLVLDVTLPDLDGLDLQQRVTDRTDMPVIFITAQTDVLTSVRAMKAGALEYLTKPLRDDVVLSAIDLGLERSQASLSAAAATRGVRECYASLTRREREVMELVTSGWLNKQIGAVLGVREVTVKAHRGAMMRKMKAASLPELVKMAARLRLATVPRAKGSSTMFAGIDAPSSSTRTSRIDVRTAAQSTILFDRLFPPRLTNLVTISEEKVNA
jgi:FixJ family two-component response regulator